MLWLPKALIPSNDLSKISLRIPQLCSSPKKWKRVAKPTVYINLFSSISYSGGNLLERGDTIPTFRASKYVISIFLFFVISVSL